jgi:protocatechuate 3,4-dioxygenase beta subunit
MVKRLVVVVVALIVCGLAWLVLSSEPPAPPGPEPAPAAGAPAPERERRRQPTVPEAAAPTETPEPAEPEPGAPPVLRITVRDEAAGSPLENARVTVAPEGGGTLVARTDATGVAVIDPAPTRGADVAAFAPGFVRGFSWLAPSDEWESSGDPSVEIGLFRGERIEGRVIDPEGRPIANVQVDLEEGGSIGGKMSASGGPLLGSDRTDAAGTYAIDGVPAGEMVTLLVMHQGYARFERTVRLAEGGGNEPFEIQLAPGGAVTGTVRGPDLAPVQGATVLVAPNDIAFLLDYSDVNLATPGASQSRLLAARTGADGRYRVEGLSLDATYVALATKAGIGRSERVLGVVARENEVTVALDLGLRAVLDLTVRVVDAEGERIEGASVLCLTGRFHRVPESDDGNYRIGGLDPGDVVCDVDADGYVKQRVTHALTESGELVVRLDRGRSITGIAVNDVGEPLAEAGIRIMRPLGAEYRDLPDSLADGTTDAEGRFDVGGLRDGPHAVLCWAKGHDRGKLEPVAAGARDVRVVAPRNATVVVQLQLPPGREPPATLQQQIRRAGGGSGTGVEWPEDGRLEMAVPPIPATLILIVEGYADVPFDVELAPGEVRDLGVVALDQGVAVTGKVTDLAGRAVAGAQISATTPWEFEGRVTTTGEDGTYRLPQLARAPCEVEVVADGFMTREFERNPVEAAEWNITLRRGGLVTGTVRTADGVGVSDGTVRVVAVPGGEEDERSDFAYPDNAGRYAVRVVPGRYRVEYRPEEGDSVTGREIELTEGSEETVDFELSE